MCNAFLKHQFLGRIGIPRSRRVPGIILRNNIIILHISGAGNGQNAIRVDTPGQIFAAAAENDISSRINMKLCIKKRFVAAIDCYFLPLSLSPQVIHIFQAAAAFKGTVGNARHTLWNRYAGQTGAAVKGKIRNARYALRDYHTGQAAAVSEGKGFDCCHTFRYRHAGQSGAACEGTVLYARQACRNHHIGQILAVPEGFPSETCHALRNCQTACKATPSESFAAYVRNSLIQHQLHRRKRIPGSRRTPVSILRDRSIIPHSASAGDGQGTPGVNAPGQILAALAAGCSNLHKGKAIFLCVALRRRAGGAPDHQILKLCTVVEAYRFLTDGRNGSRNRYFRQISAADTAEVDLRQPIRQNDGSQILAITKSLSANLLRSGRYRIGSAGSGAGINDQFGAVFTEKHIVLCAEVRIAVHHSDLFQTIAEGEVHSPPALRADSDAHNVLAIEEKSAVYTCHAVRNGKLRPVAGNRQQFLLVLGVQHAIFRAESRVCFIYSNAVQTATVYSASPDTLYPGGNMQTAQADALEQCTFPQSFQVLGQNDLLQSKVIY